MATQIHVLPVGEDIRRLTLPITSGAFEVDEVLLMTVDEEDRQKRRYGPQPESFQTVGQSGSSTEPEAVLELEPQAADAIERTLNDHGIPVKRMERPDYSDYATVFEEAYNIFQAQSDGERVTVNVSSIPAGAAIAFGAAATAMASEENEWRERIEVYYVPAAQNFGSQAYRRFTARKNTFDMFSGRLNTYLEKVETIIFENMTQSVQERLGDIHDTVDTLKERVPEELEKRERYEELQSQSKTHLDRLSEAFDISNFRWMREEGFQEVAYSQELVEDLRETFRMMHDEFDMIDRLVETLIDEIDDLEPLLEEVWEVREWSREFTDLAWEIEEFSFWTQKFIEDVNHYGLNPPLRDDSGELPIVTCSIPPTRDLKDTEKLILQALDSHGSFTRNSNLATAITKYASERSFKPVNLSESPGLLPKDVEEQLEELFEDRKSRDVLEELQEQLEKRLQSRLQYNLGSLEASGFIVREQDEKDKRRKRIELSATGKLWTSSHNIDSVCEEPIVELVTSQIEQYAASGDF